MTRPGRERRGRGRRPGYTLVEVLVAMAASSVVMYAAYQLVHLGSSSTRRGTARADSAEAAGSVLVQLGERIRYAADILEPGGGGVGGTLELSRIDTGAWTVSVDKQGDLVLAEKFGKGRKVLARGMRRIEFRRNGSETDYLEVEVWPEGVDDSKGYRTGFFTRGTLRPPKGGDP